MDFLYVARARDMCQGNLLESKKVGIALSNIDKRISSLNSTKMPISVELEAGFDFTGLKVSARDAEYIIHSILSHDRVNGEWFKDPDNDLVDRVKKAAYRMGAQPLESQDKDIVEMNSKQKVALTKMKELIEPLANDLSSLGFDWEYMTWKIGVSLPVGRLHVNVNETDLRLFLVTEMDSEQLSYLTSMPWRNLALKNRKSLNILKDEFLPVLIKLKELVF